MYLILKNDWDDMMEESVEDDEVVYTDPYEKVSVPSDDGYYNNELCMWYPMLEIEVYATGPADNVQIMLDSPAYDIAEKSMVEGIMPYLGDAQYDIVKKQIDVYASETSLMYYDDQVAYELMLEEMIDSNKEDYKRDYLVEKCITTVMPKSDVIFEVVEILEYDGGEEFLSAARYTDSLGGIYQGTMGVIDADLDVEVAGGQHWDPASFHDTYVICDVSRPIDDADDPRISQQPLWSYPEPRTVFTPVVDDDTNPLIGQFYGEIPDELLDYFLGEMNEYN